MTTRQHITLDGKHYVVLRHGNGTVSIVAQWETIMPQEVWSARPSKTQRSSSVSPTGRIGRRVLAAADRELQARELHQPL